MLNLAALLVLGAQPCGAMDLPTVLSQVMARSDELAVERAEVLAAKADLSLARALGVLAGSTATLLAGPVPGAHGSVLAADNTNRNPLRGLGPFSRVDVQLVQPVWTWGALESARAAAGGEVRARTLLVEGKRQELQLRAASLFWGVMLAQRLLAIAAEVEGALAQVTQRIDQSLAAGKGELVEADRYRVEVFRGVLLGRKAQAREGLQLARAALAAMLAVPEHSLHLKDEKLLATADAAAPDEERLVSQAERQRPDVGALDEAIRAVEAEVRAREAQRLPTVFVAGLFAYSYAPNRTVQLNPWVTDYFNALEAGVGLGVRQELDFPRLEAELQRARAKLEKLRRERSGLDRLVRLQLEAGRAELLSAEERLAAAQGALKAGKAWFRSTGINFELGVQDARGLVEAYVGYVQTQVDEAQARFDVKVAQVRLAQLVGELLVEQEASCSLPS